MRRVIHGRRADPRRGAGSRLVARGRRVSQALRRRSAVERYTPTQQLTIFRWGLLELACPGRWLH
jgi:hypothetical protein